MGGSQELLGCCGVHGVFSPASQRTPRRWAPQAAGAALWGEPFLAVHRTGVPACVRMKFEGAQGVLRRRHHARDNPDEVGLPT